MHTEAKNWAFYAHHNLCTRNDDQRILLIKTVNASKDRNALYILDQSVLPAWPDRVPIAVVMSRLTILLQPVAPVSCIGRLCEQ